MKKFSALRAVLAIACLCGSAQGALTWSQLDFTSVDHGAISYNSSGNVVQDGTAFFDAVTDDNFVSTQIVSGDGIDNPISGNFGFYAVLNITDDDGLLTWLSTHPFTPLAIEVRAWDVDLDVDIRGNGSFDESFTLNADGLPWQFLTATFNEIIQPGCTDLAGEPGDGFDAWFDLAYNPAYPGKLAISIVLNGFAHDGWSNPFDAAINAGDALQGYTPNVTPGSGIRVAAIPEPATMLVWGLLGLVAVGYGAWRRRAS